MVRIQSAPAVAGVLCWFAALLFGHNRAPLDRHRASRDACTTTSPATWGQAGRRPAGAVNMDSNASRAREVERKCELVRFYWIAAQAWEQRRRCPPNPALLSSRGFLAGLPDRRRVAAAVADCVARQRPQKRFENRDCCSVARPPARGGCAGSSALRYHLIETTPVLPLRSAAPAPPSLVSHIHAPMRMPVKFRGIGRVWRLSLLSCRLRTTGERQHDEECGELLM